MLFDGEGMTLLIAEDVNLSRRGGREGGPWERGGGTEEVFGCWVRFSPCHKELKLSRIKTPQSYFFNKLGLPSLILPGN